MKRYNFFMLILLVGMIIFGRVATQPSYKQITQEEAKSNGYQ